MKSALPLPTNAPLCLFTAPLNFTCNHFVPLCATILDRFSNLSRENSVLIENYCGNDGELWKILTNTLQVVCAGEIKPTLREMFSRNYSPNCFETVTAKLQIVCADVNRGVFDCVNRAMG